MTAEVAMRASGSIRGVLARVVIAACAAIIVTAVAAHAAELTEAELDGVVNEISVEQGSTASFSIALKATGSIRCSATPSSPALARLNTSYALDAAGAITGANLSAGAPFYADAFCNVTWPGDPTAQIISASVSADIDTPTGAYTLRLRPTLSTPGGTGAMLRDDTATLLRFVVTESSDRVPPAVRCDGPHGTLGDDGWFTSAVTHDCRASDARSGLVDPADADFTLATNGEGDDRWTAQHIVEDRAGNATQAGPFGTFDVDLNDPRVEVASPADGATYVLGAAATADFDCDDSASGVRTCVGSVANGDAIDTSAVGTHTLAVEATDRAGRTTTRTVTYEVVYEFGGIGTPSSATARTAGAALPLSWSLGGVGDLSTLTAAESAPCAGGSAEAITSDVRYSAGNATFHLVWKTSKSWAGTCRQVRLSFDDGTTHTLDVELR